MAGARREPRRLALASLALAAAVACGSSGSGGTAAPSVTAAPTTAAPSTAAEPRLSAAVVTPAPGPQTVIGVIGDYGVVGSTALPQVVTRMTRFNGGRALSAVVTTGDNAYCCGTETQAAFARKALAPLRLQGAPVYSALGNHDVQTEGGAAFMRTFPQAKRWYTANVGDVQLVVLDSTRTGDATQLRFLKAVLAAPRPRAFRVVVFHHPAWSCSAHGPDAGVRERWLPLFGTKVDLVLAGHNHTYERFTSASGVPLVTTGGGGAQLYASASPACRGAGRLAYLKTVHHAVRLVASGSSLRLEGVAVDGTVFDTVTVRRR
jgi:hypothetical protein